MNPSISLTSFVDFAMKAGVPQLTEARRIYKQYAVDGYAPAGDYYRVLRDSIVDLHRGGRPKNDLDAIVGPGLPANRRDNYREMIRAYKRFLGRKSVEWFEPPSGAWRQGVLQVRVNPELGLDIDGTPFVVKLYFKSDPLPKNRALSVTHLMETTLRRRCRNEETMGVLDVKRGKLIHPTLPDPDLELLLRAQANAFLSIWADLDQRSPL